MTDHMWKPIDEDFPDGCVWIKVMYNDDTTRLTCSCDVHWDMSKENELPLYWKEDLG